MARPRAPQGAHIVSLRPSRGRPPQAAKRRTRRQFGYVRRLPSKMYQASYLGPDGLGTTHRPPSRPRATPRRGFAGTVQDHPEPVATRSPTGHREHAGRVRRGLAGRPEAQAAHPGSSIAASSTPRSFRVLGIGHAVGDHPRRGSGTGTRTWTRAQDGQSTRVRAAAHDPGDRRRRRTDPGQPVPDRRGRLSQEGKEIRPATLDRAGDHRHRDARQVPAMVVLASWCALRYGELAELRRHDLDVTRAVINISGARAVTWPDGQPMIGDAEV